MFTAYFKDCDPLKSGRIEKPDQVSKKYFFKRNYVTFGKYTMLHTWSENDTLHLAINPGGF